MTSATYRKPTLAEWVPAICLSSAAFIFVTTELLPVGLLTDISRTFGKTEAATGLLLTIYAWMVALMSLPLTILSAKVNRRTLVLLLLLLFALSNVFASLSASFMMLVTARLCIALCHALFWSIATPLAARVAPRGKRAKALSLIVAGTSVAMVLGIPAGTLLGQHLGWRVTFAVVGAAAFFLFLLMFRLLPSQPSENSGTLRSLPPLFHRRDLLLLYLLTLLTVTGHFTVSTYFTPYMSHVGGFSPQVVAMLLLVFGGSGIAGSALGGKFAERYPDQMVFLPLCVIFVCLVGIPVVKTGLVAAICLCFFWGAAMTCMNLVFQTRVMRDAPEATDVAVSIYSGIYNIGIGGGALIGSQVYALAGITRLGYAGATATLLAALVAAFFFLRRKGMPE